MKLAILNLEWVQVAQVYKRTVYRGYTICNHSDSQWSPQNERGYHYDKYVVGHFQDGFSIYGISNKTLWDCILEIDELLGDVHEL